MEPTDKVSLTYEQLQALGAKMGADIGKAKVLTTADYNWPTTGTPNSVALWLLEPGLYVSANTSVALRSSLSSGFSTGFAIVGKPPVNENIPILVVLPSSIRLVQTRLSDGQQILAYGIPLSVIDNLTSTSTAFALSANQGRVLKGLIDSIAIRGAGAPTTSTVGEVGQLYEDGTNGALYQLKSIDITTTPNTYNWEQVGGSSVNVVQTTGTSTADVMSQDAVTSMVYADPSTKLKMQIGNNALSQYNYGIAIGAKSISGNSSSIAIGSSDDYNYNTQATGQSSVAIGYDCRAEMANSVAIGNGARATQSRAFAIFGTASAAGAVAIGAGSSAASQGEVNFGSTSTVYGYNSSNYRLLTGLYDPQSGHDAATKGYVDGLIAALEARIAALEGN